MKVEVVPAHAGHIHHLAVNMRADDRREIWAAGCMLPRESLEMSLERSRIAWTGLVDGVPVCMFGVAAEVGILPVGRPWLLGTDDIEKHQRAFLRRNRQKVAEMLSMYPLLVNYVDARNKASIKWLQWLGFTVDENTIPVGVNQVPFRRFEMTRG